MTERDKIWVGDGLGPDGPLQTELRRQRELSSGGSVKVYVYENEDEMYEPTVQAVFDSLEAAQAQHAGDEWVLDDGSHVVAGLRRWFVRYPDVDGRPIIDYPSITEFELKAPPSDVPMGARPVVRQPRGFIGRVDRDR